MAPPSDIHSGSAMANLSWLWKPLARVNSASALGLGAVFLQETDRRMMDSAFVEPQVMASLRNRAVTVALRVNVVHRGKPVVSAAYRWATCCSKASAMCASCTYLPFGSGLGYISPGLAGLWRVQLSLYDNDTCVTAGAAYLCSVYVSVMRCPSVTANTSCSTSPKNAAHCSPALVGTHCCARSCADCCCPPNMYEP